MSKLAARIVVPALLAALLCEGLLGIAFARTLIDEGEFLSAALRVSQGALPYRDFPIAQPPAVAYLLALFTGLFGATLAVGRAVSWLGLAALGWGAARLCTRLAGTAAAAASVVLLMLDLPGIYVASTVRTQALATPLLMLGALALAVPWKRDLGHALAPSLLLGSTALRLTNGLAFAAVALLTALSLRNSPRRLARVGALLLAQALVFFAPMWLEPRSAWFHVVSTQLSRGERGGLVAEGFVAFLGSRFAFLANGDTRFVPILALALLTAGYLAVRWARGWRPRLALPIADPASGAFLLLVLAALAFAPQLVLAQMHFEYFVGSSALLAPAVALAGADLAARGTRAARAVAGVAALALVLGVVHTARHFDAFLDFGRGSFPRFVESARALGERVGEPCTMLTFQTQLAVAAGCPVLSGLEYSLFSFRRDLDTPTALAHAVLNPELVDRAVREQRPEVIALTPTYARRLRIGEALPPPDAPLVDVIPAARGAYTEVGKIPVAAGVRVRGFPGTTRISIFLRNDLVNP